MADVVQKNRRSVLGIIGRGEIELTRDGVFFVRMEKAGKWSDEELKQITAFIDEVSLSSL